eukprot:3003724-Pyramimonas_sp.AAC.3
MLRATRWTLRAKNDVAISIGDAAELPSTLYRDAADLTDLWSSRDSQGGWTRNDTSSVSIVDVADNVLTGIFDTILKWYLKDTGFVREAQDMSSKLIEATLQVRVDHVDVHPDA